ncbi:MAG: hypothetical protein ACREN5_03360, partial [Gemmatimonadales bacterium]
LVQLWGEVGALRIWIPEVGEATAQKRDTGYGIRDTAIDKLARDPVLLTASMATNPASALTRLKCSNAQVERARVIGEWRGRYPDPRQLSGVRRWMSEVGDYANDLLALIPARDAPRIPYPVSRLSAVVDAIRASGDPLSLKDLAVDGNDLMAAGMRPGPEVGETLKRLLGEVLEDPRRNTKEYLLSRV